MKLGCIILTYNRLDMLQVLVRQTLEYTSGDFQIYVVENGQQTATIEWLKTQPVKAILNESNLGISASWNIGIREALKDGCTHFAHLSDDIELAAGWWDACREEFEKGSHLVSVNANLRHIIFSGWFLVIDREALDKVGYWDEQFRPFYFEDLDYSERFKASGLKHSFADIEVIHHGSATIIGLFREKHSDFFWKTYRKNKRRFRAKYPHLKFRM